MASWSLGDLELPGQGGPVGRAFDNYLIGRETGLSPQGLPSFEEPRPLNIVPAPSAEDDDGEQAVYVARHEQAVKDIAEMAKRQEAEEQQAAEEAAIKREGVALADRIANRFTF